MRIYKLILLLVITLFSRDVSAQFYNGSQQTFGKNRIQYSGYLWSHCNFEQFEVYFYEEGRNLADYVARSSHLQIKEFEKMFEHKLQTKIQFIVYNSQSQSRESNIGNFASETGNTGGSARTKENKVFLYFNGSHKDLDRQIRSGVAAILLQEIIYGDDYKEVLKNSALITLPSWFINGLVSYLSEKWSVQTENKVKAAFRSGKFNEFTWLKGNDAVLAGHSIWYYIADNYGENSIANVLYMAKVNRSVENGLLFSLGKGTSTLLLDWQSYYQTKMIRDDRGKVAPDHAVMKLKVKRSRIYNRYMLNADQSYAAYTTNELSQTKVWVYSKAEQKAKRIFKKGHKLDIEPDYSFPVLAWHPGGKVLSVFYEHKGELKWLQYNVETEEETVDKIVHLEKILEASYAPNGNKMVFSAVQDGKTNIYVYDIRARAHEQITNDYYDDRSPIFLEDMKTIAFSSNRDQDTMGISGIKNAVYQKNTDLFLYNYAIKPAYKFKDQILRRITNTKFINETAPQRISNGELLYLSDANGIINQWYSKMDSSVAFVDTAIHYNYFSTSRPVSNYSENILHHSLNAQGEVTLIFKKSDKMSLQQVNLSTFKDASVALTNTEFRVKSAVKDTVQIQEPIQQETITLDSIRDKTKKDPNYIYTDYFLFKNELEGGKDSVVSILKGKQQKVFSPLIVGGYPTSDSAAPRIKIRNYELSFRTKEVAVQLDNRFLNPQYQRYSGGGGFANPGMNGFMNYSVIDLMEDYQVVGGFRIGDFQSNEVYISFTDRKKLLDKQYLLYRNTHLDLEAEDLTKNVVYEGIYRLSLPFSMVDRFETTFSLRYDQFIPLSANKELLDTDVKHEYWPNIRLAYVFDNTRELAMNLYAGTRFKIFSEYYQQAPEWNKQMVTFGADFRNYIKIHRDLIWANRLAGGTSWGSQRLMYYMGGVDSWLSQKFNQDLAPGELRQGSDYAFQTLATNMRGFDQNIRNGTSFMALNSEIRWPAVKYFIKRPLTSSFLNNFQIIVFGDLGTAWTGVTPFSEENSLNEKTIIIGEEANTGNINLRTHKEPIIGGYGAGMRTKLWGYFVRADWAWGVEDGVNQGRKFYISLTTDF